MSARNFSGHEKRICIFASLHFSNTCRFKKIAALLIAMKNGNADFAGAKIGTFATTTSD